MAGLDIATCSCDCHKDPIMAHCDYCNAHYPLPEDTYYAIERALNAGLPAFAVVWPAHDDGTPDYSKEPLHACRYGQEIEFDG